MRGGEEWGGGMSTYREGRAEAPRGRREAWEEPRCGRHLLAAVGAGVLGEKEPAAARAVDGAAKGEAALARPLNAVVPARSGAPKNVSLGGRQMQSDAVWAGLAGKPGG